MSSCAMSDTTRGCVAGGNPGPTNIIEYITIASTGDATDFGDLSAVTGNMATISDAHGGLQN